MLPHPRKHTPIHYKHPSHPFSLLKLLKPKHHTKHTHHPPKIQLVQTSHNEENSNKMNLSNFFQTNHGQNFPQVNKGKRIDMNQKDIIEKIQILGQDGGTMIQQEVQQQTRLLREGHIFTNNNKFTFGDITNNLIQEQLENLPKEYKNKQPPYSHQNTSGVINLSKKIKKISKPQKYYTLVEGGESYMNQKMVFQAEVDKIQRERQSISEWHRWHMSNFFKDSQVIVDSQIYRKQIINQRIDNDVDTDEEQISSGIKRFHKSLVQAAQLNKQ